MLTVDGHAKLADFGIAKARGQLHQKTATGQFKGKAAYAAPEQLTGNFDRRSDIFSMGWFPLQDHRRKTRLRRQ